MNLQYFATYHFDQVEKMFLKYEITADDITRARGNTTTSATDISDILFLQHSKKVLIIFL